MDPLVRDFLSAVGQTRSGRQLWEFARRLWLRTALKPSAGL
jgi:hypothetical protein